MTNPPTISIVTPCFNASAFLDRTLESIHGQEYPALEHVVMDGGSTDGSVRIIRKYASRLAHWESKPDHGQYDAINKGFARTTGAIMGWLNSDDSHLPWTLSTVAEIFDHLPEVDWITTLFPIIIDGEGRSFEANRWLGHSRRAFNRGMHLPGWKWYSRDFLMQEGTFWRRSLWEKAGGKVDASLTMAGDFELWSRFFDHSEPCGVDVPLACFRKHGGQKIHDGMDTYYREAEDVLRRRGRRIIAPVSGWVRLMFRRVFGDHIPRPFRTLFHGLGMAEKASYCIRRGGGWTRLYRYFV